MPLGNPLEFGVTREHRAPLLLIPWRRRRRQTRLWSTPLLLARGAAIIKSESSRVGAMPLGNPLQFGGYPLTLSPASAYTFAATASPNSVVEHAVVNPRGSYNIVQVESCRRYASGYPSPAPLLLIPLCRRYTSGCPSPAPLLLIPSGLTLTRAIIGSQSSRVGSMPSVISLRHPRCCLYLGLIRGHTCKHVCTFVCMYTYMHT